MEKRGSRLNREIWAVGFFVLAIIITLSLLSYDPQDQSLRIVIDFFRSGIASLNSSKTVIADSQSGTTLPTTAHSLKSGSNWIGPVGSCLASVLRVGFGFSAYLLPVFLSIVSYGLLFETYRGLRLIKIGASVLLLISVAIILEFFRSEMGNVVYAGGNLGYVLLKVLVQSFGKIGASVIAVSLLILAVILLLEISLASTWKNIGRGVDKLQKWAVTFTKTSVKQLQEWRKKRKAENRRKEQPTYLPPAIILEEELKEVKDDLPRKPKKKSPPLQPELPLPAFDQAYTLPSPSLLDSSEGEHVTVDRATLEANSLILQRKLADLGVEGKILELRPGPVITMYKFEPASGVKVKRIVTLADDLAMALRAISVRILAPIPGEATVGIEIPNPKREKVLLKQVIGSDAYQNSESQLTLALGKDISGTPFMADLARMPHLLVAGATGTGKSVSLNAMILSMLFKATPRDVQFIMIDPKMLELTVYEDLPHLLVPVVTDPKKAAAALFWAMDEMDRRYRLMREKRARNIDQYNRILEKETADKATVINLKDPEESEESDEITGDAEEQSPLVHEHLPRVVIVVDELADLMMSVRRDIEEHVTRLAQKARAAGIHMILATQRPSVDVITGLIKANFPARISFQVTSRVDSRTILDSIGAERLLGEGDMLYLPPGTARLTRIHGAYVSDQEVRKVVEHIKKQEKPRYRPDIFEGKREIDTANGDDDYDDMYDQAVKLVTDTEQASISMIQRRLRVGYNRAARIIERMEKEGVIGPADGARPREVIVRKIED